MAAYDALLKPLTIKHLTIRNRVMSTAHAPGCPEGGMPTERYQLYHAEKAKGGIGLTIFGGSSSVAVDSPATAFGQVAVYDDEVIPYFQEFADPVHGHGAALMCQITHMGRRNNWDTADWLTLIAPSPVREHSHRAMPKEMEDWDFKRVIKSFGQAARRCKDGGLDGIELMFGAQHLIDQFHTPMVNQRTDNYAGSLENRMRFGIEVLEEVRRVVGDDFVVGARMTGDELDDGGYGLDEGIKIAQTLARTGMIDFLNVFHSHTADHMGVAVMMPNMSFPVGALRPCGQRHQGRGRRAGVPRRAHHRYGQRQPRRRRRPYRHGRHGPRPYGRPLCGIEDARRPDRRYSPMRRRQLLH